MAIIRTACAHALLLLAAANAGTSPEGKTWLEAKAKEDGVVALESGLMYKVLRDGDGENHPKASTSCECHYEGKLIDGTVFDSSYERGSPTSFAPNQVIKGWTEAMQLMVEGCVEINQLGLRSRGQCRVDGVGRPKFDFHTGDDGQRRPARSLQPRAAGRLQLRRGVAAFSLGPSAQRAARPRGLNSRRAELCGNQNFTARSS